MVHQQIGLAVTVEHAHGQLELCDPGPRVELDLLDPELDGDDDDQLELTGVRDGARWRRRNRSGKPVSWDQLDLQLGGIKMRRRRAGVWSSDKAAARTMANVRAQTYCAADFGALDAVSLPAWARARWELTGNEEKLLGWLWRAYENKTGGVFDCMSTIASDLRMSERTLRNVLHGRGPDAVSPRPGLVERGLVRLQITHREGTQGRSCDDGWWLMRIGVELETLGHEAVNARGPIARRSGYTRTAARRARQRLSSEARGIRRERAGAAWRRRQPGRLLASARPPASSSSSSGSYSLGAPATCTDPIPQTKAATVADKPTPAGDPLRGPLPPGLGEPGGETASPQRPAERSSLRSPRSVHVAGAPSEYEPDDDDELAGGRALAKRRPKFGDDPRWLAMHGHEPDATHVAAQLARHELAVTSSAELAAVLADCARVVYGDVEREKATAEKYSAARNGRVPYSPPPRSLTEYDVELDLADDQAAGPGVRRAAVE